MKPSNFFAMALPALAACAIVSWALPAESDPLKDILKTEATGNIFLAQSQRQIDGISDDTSELVDQYRNVIVQIETLKVYNAQLRKLIGAQKADMVTLNEQIDYVTLVERRIMPLVQDMIDSLDQFVASDIPFMKAEREDRIARLNALMVDSAVTTSERYRQVLSAFEIEGEYGRKVGAYQGDMDVDGVDQTVNFLHVGRIAYLYQTRDKERTFVWDHSNSAWETLDSSYNGPVYEAIQMARGFIQSDVVELPVFAPQELAQ